MNRNKLNFEEISQSMEVLDRDSQRGVKGGLTAAEMLADIAANGIDKYAGKTITFDGGQYGYISNNVSIDSGSIGGGSGYTYNGGWLAEVVVTATPLRSGSVGLGEPPLAKYVGNQSKYPGAIIIETSLMSGGAVTLPPFVFTAPGSGNNQDLMRHEYGHILQYGGLSILSGSPVTGYGMYLLSIGVPSIFSADKSNNDPSHFHQGTYTEKSANQLSYWFEGMPANWNDTKYPVYYK